MDAKVRIGVLLETSDAAVAASLPPDGFETRLGGSDDVVVFRAASWTTRDAPARIRALCREQGLDRVIIGGPSFGSGLLISVRVTMFWKSPADSHSNSTRAPTLFSPSSRPMYFLSNRLYHWPSIWRRRKCAPLRVVLLSTAPICP